MQFMPKFNIKKANETESYLEEKLVDFVNREFPGLYDSLGDD